MSELHPSQRSSPPAKAWVVPEFMPDARLNSAHLMTIAPLMVFRPLKNFANNAFERLFKVEKDVRILGHCHFHPKPKEHFTLILLHGLESSSDAPYMLGIARKAFYLGLNVIRLNMRNCGGSMHLAPTLYNGGLSSDILAVLKELELRDGLDKTIIAGYSLGGNIVLKAAAENSLSRQVPLMGVAAVSPSIDLELAVTAIERPFNRPYEQWFLRTLKQKIVHKAKLYPKLYDASGLKGISSIRAFDDFYTAPHGGYKDANHYYKNASSIHLFESLNVPSLIIASKDDPIVPFDSFKPERMNNKHIHFITSQTGGHGAFVQAKREDFLFDKFWAENRVVSFCQEIVEQYKLHGSASVNPSMLSLGNHEIKQELN